MESRFPGTLKTSPLPQDFTRMAAEVFSTNFAEALRSLETLKPGRASFEVTGVVHPKEVVLAVTLSQEGRVGATTVYASSDFDPQASSPTLHDLLAACVDAAGALLGQLLDPDHIEQLAADSLSALEDAPFDWTPLEIERRTIHLKVDRANPKLDSLADEFLAKNDPKHAERTAREAREAEELFRFGPQGPRKKPPH